MNFVKFIFLKNSKKLILLKCNFLLNFMDISLIIYDLSGKEVISLVSGYYDPGSYTINWNAQNIPTGTYFIRFSTPQYSATRKVSLIK